MRKNIFRRSQAIALLPVLGLLFLHGATTQANSAYGTINNFDTVNDTGVECHGFEIELEHIHSVDITYTYNWNHYGTPKIIEDNSSPLRPRVRVRYESGKKSDGSWSAYTAIPAGPIAPTDGHRFTDPSINFGGEHFGLGYRGNPTNITYHWLVDDGAGNLVRGPAVTVATPAFVYYPPNQGAPAQVQAAIRPAPAPPLNEFGPPVWVKEIRTTSHNDRDIQLRDLIDDDEDNPDDKNWRNGEPDEVEVEWQILQTEFKKDDGGRNGELVGAPEELPDGDEIITRRYEFFEYVGPLDPESGEVMTENVGADNIHGTLEFADTVVVGNYIGSQMSAFDHELPVAFIEHVPSGDVQEDYPPRTIVIAAVSFQAAVTEGNLPQGLFLHETTGQLSGVPLESGVFEFVVRVTASNQPPRAKKFILPIADIGAAVPPYSIVELDVFPVNGGSVRGGGFCLNDTVSTVVAEPAPGFALATWTENGKVVNRSSIYTFTNVVHRTLIANFVPMPSLAVVSTADNFVMAWPTNFQNIAVEQITNVPGQWVPLAIPASILGTNYIITVPLSGSQRFFRLKAP
jgi:hypothetical protein